MIALIRGITAAMASLQPKPVGSPAGQKGFEQILNTASRVLGSGEPPALSEPPRYTVQPGDSLTAVAKKFGYEEARILARANHIQNPDCLQVGQVLILPENNQGPGRQCSTDMAASTAKSAAGRSQAAGAPGCSQGRGRLVAVSWYGSRHHGRLMANGQPFDMHADTAAHKHLPLGTRVTLTNPKNGATVKVRVTDRGPYVPGRSLDISYSAARKLGVVENGVAKVWMEGG